MLPLRTQSPDTPPDIEEMILEHYRRMTPQEKLALVIDLNRAAQAMAAARIRAQYGPDLPEHELNLRLAALWLDRETMIKAFRLGPGGRGVLIGPPPVPSGDVPPAPAPPDR